MINEIAVVGFPSTVGGADTEMAHQLECWLRMGLHVHIVPTDALSEWQKKLALHARAGITVYPHKQWATLTGKHVINFCSGVFLSEIKAIRAVAKSTTFINCMTYAFEKEIEATLEGLISLSLYQTDHQMGMVGQKMTGHPRYHPMRFTPYFHADEFPFHSQRPADRFRVGRISRPDGAKFGAQQLGVYRGMVAPVLKEAHIVGWCTDAHAKCGEVDRNWMKTYGAGGLEQKAFYKLVDAVVMTTDTHENLPRVAMEAMASGSILVVDRRGGWINQIEDGVTGWLCGDSREMVYKASRAAFEPRERSQMCQAARASVESKYGYAVASESWSKVFEQMEKV